MTEPIYDTFTQAILACARSSREREYELNTCPIDMLPVEQPGGFMQYQLVTTTFTFIVTFHADIGRWAYDWTWTDTAKR